MKAGNIDQRSTRYDIAEIHAGVGDLAEWIGQRYGVLVGSRRGKITPTECPQAPARTHDLGLRDSLARRRHDISV